MKRILIAVLIVCMMLPLFVGCTGQACMVLDNAGNTIATLTSRAAIENSAHRAYLEIVLDEAVALLCELYDCNETKAEKMLFSKGYVLSTALDDTVSQCLQDAADARDTSSALACAVTDLQGRLIAVCSSDDNVNYATRRTSPYSSFKPLSVYMQAVENGVADWSSLYRDSAYKQIEDDSGNKTEWPENPTGSYADKNVTLSHAIEQSLNTVAVKCLKDVGVDRSIAFLQSAFDMPLEEEQLVSALYGEEEILGNMALGYLSGGVSVVDMAGYYQVFDGRGEYLAPKAILSVCDADGQTIYAREEVPLQVIGTSTSQIMNRLLQGVVSPSATGSQAAVDGVQVAGKTGTGDNNTDNWFVGVTPHYSCAVWHGEADSNTAAAYFSQAMSGVYMCVNHPNTSFVTRVALETVLYCTESGMAASPSCHFIDVGYYADGNTPDVCDRHEHSQ